MSDMLFERAVRDWLEEGSDRTPLVAIDAVLLAVKTTPQDRALRIPRAFGNMPTFMRLATAIAIVAVLGAGTLLYLNKGTGVGDKATSTPLTTSSATADPAATPGPIDTTSWIPYVSDRYGFSVHHPADWEAIPGDRDYFPGTDAKVWASSAPDAFFHPGATEGLGVRVSVWSTEVAPGTTIEGWVDAFCRAAYENAPCVQGYMSRAVAVETKDHHPGLLLRPYDVMAFFLEGETLLVIAVWREETDPAVQPYGGARRLLEGFISTLTFPGQP